MRIPSFVRDQYKRLPSEVKGTIMARSFGFFKIPLIFMISPKVELLTMEECRIKVPLNRITRNHVGSLYFGALAIAADLTGGILAMHVAGEAGIKMQLLFKGVRAEFHKRCEADTLFVCEDGDLIMQKLKETKVTGERVTFPVKVKVYVPSQLAEELAAEVELNMSLKAESNA